MQCLAGNRNSILGLLLLLDNKIMPFFLFFFIFIIDTIADVLIFPLFAPFLPAPTPLPRWPSPHCCLRLQVIHKYSQANTFYSPSFIQSPLATPPTWPTAVSLFHVSVPLYFAHQFILFIEFHI